jgi:hypothetical protein
MKEKHCIIVTTSGSHCIYSPSVLIEITLLSIPSPNAFFPTTWNSYVVSGVSLFMVTWVLPDGVTGIVDQSAIPGSLYLN